MLDPLLCTGRWNNPPLRAPPNIPSILDCSYAYDIQKGY
jgi:hypothetical protein